MLFAQPSLAEKTMSKGNNFFFFLISLKIVSASKALYQVTLIPQ